MDLAHVLVLQQDHSALDLTVLFGEAGGGELLGVRASGIEEGEAFGSVLVWVLQVVTHLCLILKLSPKSDIEVLLI